MSLSLSQIWLHLVFSTKNRQVFLQNPGFRDEMFLMLNQPLQELGCLPQCTGGWIDHVHIVCELSPTVTIAKLVEHVKAETSKWAKKTSSGSPTFTWQAGYGAFSVSRSNLDRVVNYVERQEEHHKRHSYQEEFRELCQKHELEIDERYVWD